MIQVTAVSRRCWAKRLRIRATVEGLHSSASVIASPARPGPVSALSRMRPWRERHCALADFFEQQFSIETARAYKPAPIV